ncbi:helix-turn-helix transcriptional regulator [Kitasatospora purpeofusca]|uniref:helix-turn-helix domain-containing protein n=1 Tax=Kitasatospora purpeofusca TaxID=67352 RepID=UPI002E13ACDA|nr:helix-turn-helix transcriptional regulator [Kitasatospora purpeofusca]
MSVNRTSRPDPTPGTAAGAVPGAVPGTTTGAATAGTPGGLAEFLRTRRSRLRPEDVDLPDFGGRRRVAGLRREELAQLAGVSVDYYTRLEQGRVGNPSDAVLDAVARALRLDPEEAGHLHRLARTRPTRAGGSGGTGRGPARGSAAPQKVRPSMARLLDAMPDVPAVVMGRRMDILAWNSAAAALLGDYATLAPAERNIARITFLDPASRTLFDDWVGCARENVAFLHLEAGRRPDDPRLAELIGELSVRSQEFRQWWAEHPVRDKTSGRKVFRHPLVGRMELVYDTLRSADDPDQALVTYTADPGSPSEDALRMLISWEADRVARPH